MNIDRLPIFAIALLTACGSTPTRVFTIDAVKPHGAVAYAGPALRIDAVHVPPAVDRTEILTALGNGELRVNETEHWSAPLGQLVRQALTADLVQRLPPGRVIFPHLARPEDAVGVSVDILSWDATPLASQLTVSWTMTPGASAGAPSSQRTGTVILHGSLSSATSAAQSMSDLIAQLADRIVADLATPSR